MTFPAGCTSLTDTQLGVIRQLSMLRDLNLKYAVVEPFGGFSVCTWTPAQLSRLLDSDDSPRLQKLSLVNSEFTAALLPIFRSRLRSLTRLDFGIIHGIDPEDAQPGLENCAFLSEVADHLEEADLRHSTSVGLSDACIANIAACSRLVKLSLHWATLLPSQLQTRLRSLPALSHLTLDNRLTSLAPFSSEQTAVVTARSLRHLSLCLEFPRIPRSETRHLLALTELRHLGLHANFDPPLLRDDPIKSIFLTQKFESTLKLRAYLLHLELFYSAKP